MHRNFRRGIKIIVDKWLNIRSGEAVLIITDVQHWDEMKEVQKYAQSLGARVDVRMLPSDYTQSMSDNFDELADVMQNHEVIIGATHYSLVTTEVVKRAVRGGSRFLSLPMATNDKRSILEYGFLTMNTDKARIKAHLLLKHINESTVINITTRKGTDLKFRKIGRKASYFNGKAKDNKGFTSSSFEVYLAVEEDQTFGECVVDGSLGYLGKVGKPFKIHFDSGRLVDIEQNEFGRTLDKYMKSFNDERIYHVGELGIGLNTYSKCEGRCYIEDESAYGTAHIGFGRNNALGGNFDANGHFDIVFREPTIYADNRLIMDKGSIVLPDPQSWSPH